MHNAQKLETAQMSFNGWMVKPTVLDLYHETLLRIKNEWMMDACNIWDESPGKYIE